MYSMCTAPLDWMLGSAAFQNGTRRDVSSWMGAMKFADEMLTVCAINNRQMKVNESGSLSNRIHRSHTDASNASI